MIINVWGHIHNVEKSLGLPETPWEPDCFKDDNYFDAQEYYQYLCELLHAEQK